MENNKQNKPTQDKITTYCHKKGLKCVKDTDSMMVIWFDNDEDLEYYEIKMNIVAILWDMGARDIIIHMYNPHLNIKPYIRVTTPE